MSYFLLPSQVYAGVGEWTETVGTFSYSEWSSMTSSADGTKLVAIGDYGSIWTSTNSGATWQKSVGTENKAWKSLTSSADGTKLAVIQSYSLWTSTDSGATWHEIPNTSPYSWTSITSSADGTKLAATEDGMF